MLVHDVDASDMAMMANHAFVHPTLSIIIDVFQRSLSIDALLVVAWSGGCTWRLRCRCTWRSSSHLGHHGFSPPGSRNRMHVLLLGQTSLLTACMRACMHASVHACERVMHACLVCLIGSHQHGTTFALTQCLHVWVPYSLASWYMPLRLVPTMSQFSLRVVLFSYIQGG